MIDKLERLRAQKLKKDKETKEAEKLARAAARVKLDNKSKGSSLSRGVTDKNPENDEVLSFEQGHTLKLYNTKGEQS